jgi:hypothetical protein
MAYLYHQHFKIILDISVIVFAISSRLVGLILHQ